MLSSGLRLRTMQNLRCTVLTTIPVMCCLRDLLTSYSLVCFWLAPCFHTQLSRRRIKSFSCQTSWCCLEQTLGSVACFSLWAATAAKWTKAAISCSPVARLHKTTLTTLHAIPRHLTTSFKPKSKSTMYAIFHGFND